MKTGTSWDFYVNNETIKYTSTIEDGIFVTDVTHSPNSDWQLGFQELGLSMKKGKYKLILMPWPISKNNF